MSVLKRNGRFFSYELEIVRQGNFRIRRGNFHDTRYRRLEGACAHLAPTGRRVAPNNDWSIARGRRLFDPTLHISEDPAYFRAASGGILGFGRKFVEWLDLLSNTTEFHKEQYAIGCLRREIIEAFDKGQITLSVLVSIRDQNAKLSSIGIPTPIHQDGDSDERFARRWLLFVIELLPLTDFKSISRYKRAITVGHKHQYVLDSKKDLTQKRAHKENSTMPYYTYHFVVRKRIVHGGITG